MFERLKVRAVCTELGMEIRMAKVLVHVHGLTSGGQKPEALILKVGETPDAKLGPFARLQDRDDDLGQELRDAKRLFEDTPYREAMLGLYLELIQPRVKEMSVRDILRVKRPREINPNNFFQ